MLKFVKIILVIIFFVLPVNAEHLSISMIIYLFLGLGASPGSFVYCALILAGAAGLLISAAIRDHRKNNIISLLAVLILFIPVIVEMSRRNQLVSTWSMIGYILFFLLAAICLVLLIKPNRPIKIN